MMRTMKFYYLIAVFSFFFFHFTWFSFVCCYHTRSERYDIDTLNENKTVYSQDDVRNEALLNGIELSENVRDEKNSADIVADLPQKFAGGNDGNIAGVDDINIDDPRATRDDISDDLAKVGGIYINDHLAKKDIAGEFTRKNNDDIDALAKRIVGKDSVLKGGRRMPIVPAYVWMLYNASNDQLTDESHAHEGGKREIPTIRTVKPYSIHKRSLQADRLFLFKLKAQHKHLDRLEIVLYVRDISDLLLDSKTHILINVMASDNRWQSYQGQRFQDFVIFDISNVRSLLNSTLIMDKKILIGRQYLRIRKIFEPILVLFEHKTSNPILSVPYRVKRDAPEVVTTTAEPPSNGTVFDHFSAVQDSVMQVDIADWYHCRRYDWSINMRIFDWNWYAFPDILQAGFCSGQCPFPLDVEMLNSTNYSFLKNRWRVQTFGTDETVPGECCTPVSYLPSNIIYLSSSHEFVLKEMPDMKVVSCGCR